MSSRSPELPAAFLAVPIAHRGLHDRAAGVVENSRAAFAAAIAAGYGIEMDIQRSADGEAVVFHDDEMPRLTGLPGLVHDYTVAQLSATPLLDGGETVPTLAEVLALVAGRAPLLIEIKDQDGALGPGVGPLEARVAELLGGYAGPVALMSFNPLLGGGAGRGGAGAAARPHHLRLRRRRLVAARLPPRRARQPRRRRAHRRRLRLARPQGPRQPGGRPAQGRGPADPDLDDPQPRRGGSRAPVADNITFEGYRPALTL